MDSSITWIQTDVNYLPKLNIMKDKYLFFYPFGGGREYRYITPLKDDEVKDFDDKIVTNGIFVIATCELFEDVDETTYYLLNTEKYLKCSNFPIFEEIDNE